MWVSMSVCHGYSMTDDPKEPFDPGCADRHAVDLAAS